MTGERRLLLADDDPRDVELVLNALSRHGLAERVDVVGDGEQVLDYLYRRGRHADREGGLPAVMLLDLKMPRLDGLDVLRALSRDERMATLPIVVLTSSREHRDLAESYRLRANAFVVKPLGFNQFIETVMRLGAFWGLLNEPPPSPAALRGA